MIEQRPFTVGAGTSTIEVPIKEGYGPNVYASVVLVKGRTGKGGAACPIIRMGMTTLTVDTEAQAPEGGGRHRQAELPPRRDGHRRAEGDRRRRQAGAGRGGAVGGRRGRADADRVQDPGSAGDLLRAWGLGVTTATQYERLARLPEPGEERYATGGDGAGAPGTFRSRFLATAYWNPRIETDADGRAKVTFQAPDNLTAYRLMAVAADAASASARATGA